MVILAVIAISLVSDYTDVIRYVLGERTPLCCRQRNPASWAS
jgi:hypothetical protein